MFVDFFRKRFKIKFDDLYDLLLKKRNVKLYSFIKGENNRKLNIEKKITDTFLKVS